MKRAKSSKSRRLNQAAYKRQLKELKKARAARKREIDQEYRRQLKALRKIGVYSPKGSGLTKARKSKIRKGFKRFEEFLTGDRYIHIPILARKKSRKKKALAQAKQNNIATSPRGIFIERTRNTVKARARRNKKTGNYDLIVTSKRKGKRGAKEITEIVPLAPMGGLESELARIKADAASFGKLKPNERLAFKVSVNGGEGFSHNIYDSPEILVSDIAIRYDDMRQPFKQQFFQSISVQKTTVTKWTKSHPVKASNPYAARSNRTGRSKPISRTKKRITVRKVKEGYAVYIGAMRDSVWPTRELSMREARELRALLNR